MKSTVYSPADRELIELVKRAACQHFDITTEQLINDPAPTVANVRFICFWIISQNTHLKDYMIGRLFGKGRTAVKYGIGLVDFQKEIYRQTLDTMRKIAGIANTFEKNHPWVIQPINTTP